MVFDTPGPVGPYEIPCQLSPQSGSETGNYWRSVGFKCNGYGPVLYYFTVIGILPWPWVFSGPCRSDIPETYYLEAVKKIWTERMTCKIPDKRPTDLAVDQCETGAVPGILNKSPHIGCSSLEPVIDIRINRYCSIEHTWRIKQVAHPVVNSSKIVKKPCRTIRSACRKTVCPYQLTVYLGVFPEIDPQYDHIRFAWGYPFIVFSKDLEPRPVINIDQPFTRIVVNYLSFQAYPVAVKILTHKSRHVNRYENMAVITVWQGAFQSKNWRKRLWESKVDIMSMGFYKRVAWHTFVCLAVENKLFIEFTLKVFNTYKVFITVEISGKPEPPGYPVILKEIYDTKPGENIHAGIIILWTFTVYLVWIIQKGEINLVGDIIIIKWGFIYF